MGLVGGSTSAEAAVWSSYGGFGSIADIVIEAGDEVAEPLDMLTPEALDGIDVLYVDTRNFALTAPEQDALVAWVSAGGTYVAALDGYAFGDLATFVEMFGVDGIDRPCRAPAPVAVNDHPLTEGVLSLDAPGIDVFEVGEDAEALMLSGRDVFAAVLEPGSGFCAGGRALILGDTNMMERGFNNHLDNADNRNFVGNIIAWAQGPVVQCNVCGNGIVDAGEDCDDGPAGSADCTPACTIPGLDDDTGATSDGPDSGSSEGPPGSDEAMPDPEEESGPGDPSAAGSSSGGTGDATASEDPASDRDAGCSCRSTAGAPHWLGLTLIGFGITRRRPRRNYAASPHSRWASKEPPARS